MATKAPSHSISVLVDKREIHTSISGFWTREEIDGYITAVNAEAFPLIKNPGPIVALVDFTDFVAQDRETSDAIRNHLAGAGEVGLKRIAALGASPLVRLQYKRLSDGIEVEFFDDRISGLEWIRQPL